MRSVRGGAGNTCRCDGADGPGSGGYRFALSGHKKSRSVLCLHFAANRYLCSANTRYTQIVTHKHSEIMAKKWRCTVCGYIHEGPEAPEQCPMCKVGKEKFVEVVEQEGDLDFVTVHKLGDGKGASKELWEGLQNHFMGECTEVGMYLAMSRQADREGYPEIAEAYKRYAWEEAEHASKFAELIGEVVWDTKTNLFKRMNAECGACEDKMRLARLAKEENLDAVHDTVHEMAKDEARHGKGFEGLYKRYFGK